jgi:hypothetical protein
VSLSWCSSGGETERCPPTVLPWSGARVRTTSLDTTRPSTIFYRLRLNWASLRRHYERSLMMAM